MNAHLNSIKNNDSFSVPEWHQKIVLDRIKTFKKETFKSWNELKKRIQHK